MSVAQATLEAEHTAYERTSRVTVRVQSHVILSNGCVVSCVTRESDGRTTWLDAACGRATTDEFAERGHPFIDEAVLSWHNGDEITAPGDYERELRRATEAVVKAAATLRRVRADDGFPSKHDQTVAIMSSDEHWHDMIAARAAVIERASRAGWTVREIAAAAGNIDRTTVHRVIKKMKEGKR